MEYDRIREEARVNEMILEKANEAAEDAFYAAKDAARKGYKTTEEAVAGGYKVIEGAAVGGYKAIENAVVGGYKKVENAFVNGWEKVEETCVDVIFRREGETTQEAIERISANATAAGGHRQAKQGEKE